MFFYTNVTNDGNKILFRGYKDGSKITQKVPFTPSLFIESKSGEFKSIHGIPLERKQFESQKAMREYRSTMKDVENFNLYGTTKIPTQFINEYFDGELEFDIKNIVIKSLDIETTTIHGSIDTTNTPEEITLITMKDFNTKEIVTLGCWDFEFDINRIQSILKKQNIDIVLTRLSNFKYIQCKDEKELLQRFVEIWSSNYPDIVTGWNIELFDIPYLSNRINLILGSRYLKKCSPWDKVYEEMRKITTDRSELIFMWEGISVLDYMDMYKLFSFKKLENYKLDTVAKEELNRKKLTHEYDSFREFYESDSYAFTLYNIIDTDLIDAFEERLQLIKLVVSVAYEAKINYSDVFSRIASWESILYNFFMKHKIVGKLKSSKRLYAGIVGAYVKEIDPKVYEWNVAFDATSLYPSIIMALNMSPETIEDCDLLYSTPETITSLIERKIDLSHLKEKNLSFSANGQLFKTNEKGWFPKIIEYFFDKRQKAKKEMLRLESLNDDSPEILNKISSLNILQMAYKILLNSLYGAMGNEHFSYFDERIAEGITMTGQLIIRNCEDNINKFLSDLFKKEDDYCYYCDTDSMHITLNELVQKYYSHMTKREISHVLSKICEDVLSPEIQRICSDLGDYLNLYQSDKISFKREFIASRGVYTAKKRYCLNVYNSEGVEYDPPKNKIIGLEIVRSSTPTIVREKLKEAVNIILTGDNDSLLTFVEEFKQSWRNLPYSSIAFPTGVNGMLKYNDEKIFKSGTPIHVKSALMYNYLLNKHNISTFEQIKDGDKIKYIYLMEPNHISNNGIAFFDVIPKEFDVIKYIDYDKMLLKTFLNPLSKLTDIMKWKIEYTESLEDLFG